MPNTFKRISPASDQSNMIAQINDNFTKLDAEAVTKVFTQSGGSNAIIIGKVGEERYGMLLYDTSGVRRVFIGQAPDDGRPGVWISKEGEDVITLLGG